MGSIKKSIDGTITIVKIHNGHAREPDNTIVVNNFRNVLKTSGSNRKCNSKKYI